MSIHSLDDENTTPENVPYAPEDFDAEISTMTDRALLEEIVANMRIVRNVVADLEKSPMVAAIMSGQNPLMAMMGR